MTIEYRYCKIKNIGIKQDDEMGRPTHRDIFDNPHLDIVNHLPNNSIRLSWDAKDWCIYYCRECYYD